MLKNGTENNTKKILIEIDEAVLERLEAFKKKEHIRTNTGAAYKLIADKLDDIDRQAEVTTQQVNSANTENALAK